LLLEQPRDEVEVRLVVLHAVLALRVGLLAVVAEVYAERAVGRRGENFLHDRGHRTRLEDPILRRKREEPERRYQLAAVGGETIGVAPSGGEAAEDPVDHPLSATGDVDEDRRLAP